MQAKASGPALHAGIIYVHSARSEQAAQSANVDDVLVYVETIENTKQVLSRLHIL
jgi:hypothetical protein